MLKKNNILISKIIYNCKKYPNKKIIFDKNKSLTYSQLLSLAVENSQKIKNLKSDYIPILIDRNVESVVAILAAVFSKKIFCPISNSFPDERINLLLNILKTKKLINCSNKKLNFVKQLRINLTLKNNSIDCDFKNLNDIFYLLFTSGTTGQPKGVKLTFKNILNTLLWSKSYLKWTKHKIGIATQFSFDISMFDLFSGLYFAVPMYIFDNPSNPLESIKEIKKNNITSIFSVPTFFSNFVKYNLMKKNFGSLKRIISGGDFFNNKDILSWKFNNPKIDIFNVWGPTETSIVNTMYKVLKKDTNLLLDGKSIPVGKSHPLMKIKILKNKKILKKNKVGEICMLGQCVSKGYIGSSKNSKSYFRLNNQKAYLTGDLGYLDNQNHLHIIGRKDNTIKISGFRVDSLEIENLVNMKFKVTNSCLIKLDNSEINILCLVIETKRKLNFENILKYLKRKLPYYSVPKKIIFIKKFPLNQNNKIDRNKIKILANEK
jgi:acyl-coenzyme A synthetase/AMP-(fatty) acid ligase